MKDLSKIFQLIPQRLPMVMVDEHISTDEKKKNIYKVSCII